MSDTERLLREQYEREWARQNADQNGGAKAIAIHAATYMETAATTRNRLVRFDARALDPQRFRPVTFGWKTRLVCGVQNVLAGEEGVGKGTLEAKLIADFTRGKLPGAFEGKPVRVLWLGDEDSVDQTVGPRLHAAGADFRYVSEVT